MANGAGPPFLICFDGSDSAARAIRAAAEITGGGPALVVNAWLPPSALLFGGRSVGPSHPLAPAAREFDASARTEAEGVAAEGAKIATESGFAAEPVAVEAPDGAWRPILRLAEERDVRGVIAGSREHAGRGPALLGSVARGIANHCKRPVILVPP